MSTIYKLPLLLEPQLEPQPEGGYTITCPLWPNLVTEADTLEQVIPNVAGALAALLEAYQELQPPLPLRLTTEPQGEHHLTIPRHDPLKLGTLASIVNSIAQHFQQLKETIADKIFN